MASGWGSSIFGGRKPGASKPAAADATPNPASGPGAGPAGAPPQRRGPLPSLRELGAFDDEAPANARPRISGRLTDEDLRGAAPPRASERSLHAKTPFETVRTAEGVQLKSEADRRAALAALAAREAARRKAQAEVPPPPPPSPPPVPKPAAAALTEPAPPPPDPVVDDGLAKGAAATGKTVPGVTVGWSDLNAAVEAGWLRPEAAHAIWARWLARKPITRVEDDGTPMPPAPAVPEAPDPPAAPAPAEPPAAPIAPAAPPELAPPAPAAPKGDAPPVEPRAEAVPPAQATAKATPPADSAPASPAEPAAKPTPESTAQPTADPTAQGRPAASTIDPETPPEAWPDIDFESARDTARDAAGRADEVERPEPGGEEAPPRKRPPPDFVDAEVLEPLEEANARRAAERAAQPKPTIEVTDVIEVASLDKPAQARPAVQGTGWMVGQFALALMAALAAAVSVGLGSTLFGPWGGCAAALGWTTVAWRLTGLWHRSGQTLRALLGAHGVLPLAALTVWQFQVAMGWWPPVRPMDLFADTPLATAASAAPAMRLDWRWLALAGVPLVAALMWLLRLRQPLLLGSVTVLLWMVAFQAVAGVLQALGLAFHGMTAFMLLLGGLTLAAGLYIDLKARAAGLADFARWVYLAGLLLLGAGWVSLAPLPMPVPLLRYAGLAVLLVVVLALARPSLLALGLAFAGFDLAWNLRQNWGSDAVGVAAWALSLALTAAVTWTVTPRLPRIARRMRWWMPRAWRQALEPKGREPKGSTSAAGRAPPSTVRR